MSEGWSDLPQPLLQAILLAALPTTLCYPALLVPPLHGEAAAQQRLIAAFRGTCRAWAAAAAAALQSPALTWAVCAQRQTAAAAALLPQLEQLAVAVLDLRRLTWSEEAGGSAVAEALLTSVAFLRRSGACLRTALGVPERLCAALAASFPGLQTVGLCEDYASTERKAHSAPMQLAPLHGLQHLRCLQLELGVVELAGVPPQVRELRLVEIDRLALPTAQRQWEQAQQQGASIADRLLAAAASAGLERLRLEAASGCMVFEEAEANQLPLELELGHLARLCQAVGAAAGGERSLAGRWSVALSVAADAAVGQRRPRLQLVRQGGAPDSFTAEW